MQIYELHKHNIKNILTEEAVKGFTTTRLTSRPTLPGTLETFTGVGGMVGLTTGGSMLVEAFPLFVGVLGDDGMVSVLPGLHELKETTRRQW